MKKIYSLALLLAASFAPKAQTLVAHYDFDSCSLRDAGPYALDLSSATPITPVCTTGVRGIPNSARYFDGSNWLETTRTTRFAMASWTLSAMVKYAAFSTENCQVAYVLCSNGYQGSDSYFALETNDNNMDSSCGISSPTRHQLFGMGRNQPPLYYTYPREVVLRKETWYHLTASYDGMHMRAYVNGSLIYDLIWTQPFPAYMANPNPSVLIGSGFGAGPQYFFNGIIDDVQIWDSVRTDSAIRRSYQDLVGSLGVTPVAATTLDARVGVPYPNPAAAGLKLPLQSVTGALQVAVIAADGRVVAEHQIRDASRMTEIPVNTADLAPGVYLLRVSSGNGSCSRVFSKR